MDKIATLKDISDLLVAGNEDWERFGRVYTRTWNQLTIFNYRATAAFDGRWTFFERVSRGLIINNQTGEIVARPFEKFFNWGEGGRISNGKITLVTEKLDGSLGILYLDGGLPCIATRGSFDGEQAEWATNYYFEHYSGTDHHLPRPLKEWTLLFEIIYPDNRIVVDYGERESLVLLAARNIESGKYMPYEQLEYVAATCNFDLVKQAYLYKPAQLIEQQTTLDVNEEGWVAYFDDGSMFKFKGQQYMELHKSIMGLTWKNTVQAVREGTIQQIRDIIPEEFLDEFNYWVNIIGGRVADIEWRVTKALYNSPEGADRKIFALWAQRKHPELEHYLYAALDGRDIRPMIFDREFREMPDDH
jgi:RNA ligase